MDYKSGDTIRNSLVGQSDGPMDESCLYSAVRYVELNPVKASLCVTAEQWSWSSAKAHFTRENDDLVSVKPMPDRIEHWPEYLSIDNSDKIDDLLRVHERTGRPLGSDTFIEKWKNYVVDHYDH